jgi:hypothetical protein
MPFEPANHYVISGSGISAVVDTASIAGKPSISLEVDGQSVPDPSLTTTTEGFVVDAVVESVPDSHSLGIRLVFPEVNLSEREAVFAGFAALTRSLTSIGGPALIAGPLQFYELRPVGGTASGVFS